MEKRGQEGAFSPRETVLKSMARGMILPTTQTVRSIMPRPWNRDPAIAGHWLNTSEGMSHGCVRRVVKRSCASESVSLNRYGGNHRQLKQAPSGDFPVSACLFCLVTAQCDSPFGRLPQKIRLNNPGATAIVESDYPAIFDSEFNIVKN